MRCTRCVEAETLRITGRVREHVLGLPCASLAGHASCSSRLFRRSGLSLVDMDK